MPRLAGLVGARADLRDGWMHPGLLDLQQAAALVNVSPRTCRNWTVAGRVPGLRVGGSWRFWRPALLTAVVGAEVAARDEHAVTDLPEPGVVGVVELADLLGIHERTANLLLRQGDLPGRKIGGRWRVYWPAIRDAIATGRPLISPGQTPQASGGAPS